MKAKDKAYDLIDKMYFNNSSLSIANAIIAVDTVLETIMTGYLINNKEVANFQIEKMIYWQEVKEELIKLKQ